MSSETSTENRIIGDPLYEEGNVLFAPGTSGNILYCEEGLDLRGCSISFKGNNSLVYLSRNKHRYGLKVDMYRSNVLYVGRDNYFNGSLSLVLSERKHVVIGNDGLFSFGIWVRTADPHLIYSCDTHKRINPSKNVLIGDHVWIGQGSMILKGSRISSGSIIGANSTVSGKLIPSNESWGGAPAKKIAERVFFDKDCVHNWTKKKTKASQHYESDAWDFTAIEHESSANHLFEEIDALRSAQERLEYFQSSPATMTGKYRFAVRRSNAKSDVRKSKRASLLKRIGKRIKRH